MRKHAFIPTVEGSKLEDRVALSHVFINRSIPTVVALPGVSQNSINFTSHTFNQILNGGSGNNGLKQIFQKFSQNRNESQLNASLTHLSRRVPFGQTDLLPTWQADVAAQDFRSVGNDLIIYLHEGVGRNFNVLKSHDNHTTDNLLIYNGKVS